MTKIKTLAAAVGVAFGMLAAPAANAITISGTPYVGFVDADLFGFDSGTTGYMPSPGFAVGDSGTICSTVGTCDTAGTNPSANAIGSEDTWGIFRVNRLRDLNGNLLWQEGAGEYLYGMFYGFQDQIVEYDVKATRIDFNVWSVGGQLKIWESNLDLLNFGSNGPTGRTALDGYLSNGIQLNNGNLWLSMDAVAGQSEHAGTTLQSTFNSNSASGGSDFYSNITGGSAASLFYRDYEDENFVDRDFFIRNVNTTSGRGLWTVRADSASSSNMAIPEPGSLALLGLGLAGLAGLRRRKAAV